MADPVKTLILRAIAEAVKTIPMVGTVRRNPPTAPKRETAIFPAVWIYDATESKRRRNRYSMNSFDLQVETYFFADDDEASDKADLIDCEVYKKLTSDASIKAHIIETIEPEEASSTTKQFLDEFMAAVVSRYTVKYAHAWGDPTDQAKNP
jgi:hypothetical protein